MDEKGKIDITDLSFKELMLTLSKNPNSTITAGVLLKALENFEMNLVETYKLKL